MADEPESDEESRPTDDPVDDVETGRNGRTTDDSTPEADDVAPSDEPSDRESAGESDVESDEELDFDDIDFDDIDFEDDDTDFDDDDTVDDFDADSGRDELNDFEDDGSEFEDDSDESDTVNDYADTDGPFDYKVIDDDDHEARDELGPADEAAFAPDDEFDELPEEYGDDEFDELPEEYGAESVETTDGGYASYEDEYAYDDDGDWLGGGPESDQEMPLADHIEEMVQRIAVVLFVGLGVSLAVFALGDTVQIVNYLWNHLIPNPAVNRPRVYAPLNILLTELKVAGLAGLVVGLPVFVYETYLFMRPGLYPKERRYYLAAVPTSLVLAVFGVLFANFLILPYVFGYFTHYTTGTGAAPIATIAFGLRATFNLIIIMMGYMAIVFQIPLFIMLAIMMGVVSREWMEEKRLLFWGGFVGLSFTFVAVDPTGMAPIIIGVTMIILFEITLALLRWTGN